MVNDTGQLYTMEGIAAGVIMLITAYIVVTTTGVYTPGDTHIPDMQLEQLGSDALAMMDTPSTNGTKSDLEKFIDGGGVSDREAFKNMFLDYCNITMGGEVDTLHMSANVSYRDKDSNEIKEHLFVEPDETWTGRESAVRVTRWVQLDNRHGRLLYDKTRSQAVLVEVLIWRA